jgi:hypothetical protein
MDFAAELARLRAENEALRGVAAREGCLTLTPAQAAEALARVTAKRYSGPSASPLSGNALAKVERAIAPPPEQKPRDVQWLTTAQVAVRERIAVLEAALRAAALEKARKAAAKAAKRR